MMSAEAQLVRNVDSEFPLERAGKQLAPALERAPRIEGGIARRNEIAEIFV